MFKVLSKTLSRLYGFLFISIVVLAIVAVFFRYVLNNSIFWAEEVMRYAFIWMFFLGASDATYKGSHISLDLLIAHLKGKPEKVLRVIIELASLVFLVFMSYYGIRLTIVNAKQLTPALQIPYSFIYAAIPFGGIVMSIFTIYRIFNIIKGNRGKES